MGRLENKVALITGAAHGVRDELMGFGGAAAWMFAREGAAIVASDIDDEKGAATAEQIAAEGASASYLHLDVTRPSEWEAGVEAVLSRHGRIDILVNAAGGGGAGETLAPDSALEAWEQVIELNATGTFLGTRAVIDQMTGAGGGSIINVSSIYGSVGGPGPPGYFASKGAVRSLTKASAVQLAGRGIRVNCVCPGYALTPLTMQRFSIPEEAERRLRRVPMGAFATADDVAWAMLYLASDEAGWMTGAEIMIDGGLTAA